VELYFFSMAVNIEPISMDKAFIDDRPSGSMGSDHIAENC